MEVGLVIVPVPLDVQLIEAAFVALAPVPIFTGTELEQIEEIVPATAEGAKVTFTVADCVRGWIHWRPG